MIMTFEDLESWQQARQLTHGIYTLAAFETGCMGKAQASAN